MPRFLFFLAGVLMALGARPAQGLLEISPTLGPLAGGTLVLLTNCDTAIGNGTDITNVLVGGIPAPAINGQGTNWVLSTMPAAGWPGIKDMVIQSTSAGDTTFGRIYLYYPAGHINGPVQAAWPAEVSLTNTWLDSTNGIILAGAQTNDSSGRAVSGAGDVNGDGLADFLVGAPYADPDGRTDAGGACLVFGRTNGYPAEVTLTNTWLDGTNGCILAGSRAGDYCGYAVAGAGDVNGDGLADILVGAYQADPRGKLAAGEAYLVYGRTHPFPAQVTLTNTWLDGTNGCILAGSRTGDYCGSAVAGAGDVDHDGFADMLVGAYGAAPGGRSQAGEAYLVYGRYDGMPAQVTMTNTWLDGMNGCILAGARASDYCGSAVAGAGDVNSDGFADMLVGAYGADPDGRSAAGEAYLVYGRGGRTLPAQATLTNTWLDGNNGCILAGARTNILCGAKLAGAGDVNGDGLADFLVSAISAAPNGRTGAGETYLVYGRLAYPAWITMTNTWLDGVNGVILAGAQINDSSGSAVSGAGDVNGDGLADFLVGARGVCLYAGAACLVYGSSTGYPAQITLTNTWLDGTHGLLFAGTTTNGRAGEASSLVGDVNGDHVDDILIGAFLMAPGGRKWAGESYLVFGRNRTPGVTPASGNQAGGYPVVISGQNLGNSVDNTNVTLCGVAATIDSQTVSRVWVTADAAGGGMTGGPVRVFSASYGETVQSNAFTYEGPTLASVQEVRVMMAGGRAQICWATAAEIQTLGFNLYRREDPAGLWVKMNANLIPAEGWPQGGHGANYCFDDPGMAPEPAAQYLIEEIETSGRVVSHGPYTVATPELHLCVMARTQDLTIQWPSQDGAVYDLYWTPSLLMPFALLTRGVLATPPLNSYTGRLDQAPAGFFMVRSR